MFGDSFANPAFLWLLVLIPAGIAYWWYRRRSMVTTVQFSSLQPFVKAARGIRERLRYVPLALRLLVVASIIVALARPQSVSSRQNLSTEGIDIVLVLDISGSMLAEDFTPNRLDAAKQVAEEFIDGRQNDRIGLVIFSAESFTQCPLTLDYPVLKNLLKEVKNGMIADGTAIGLALANGVNRLKDSKAKSKVVILLTDGVNNRGEIQPIDAAKIAQTLGVKIYTVGVGSTGTARFPINDPVYGRVYADLKVEIDEDSLKKIAELTGGLYYRATDRPSLERIFDDIGRLEKTEIKVKTYTHYNERFNDFLIPALILVLFGTIAGHTRFRKLP